VAVTRQNAAVLGFHPLPGFASTIRGSPPRLIDRSPPQPSPVQHSRAWAPRFLVCLLLLPNLCITTVDMPSSIDDAADGPGVASTRTSIIGAIVKSLFAGGSTSPVSSAGNGAPGWN
jgi:hypothetical protein